MFQCLFLCLVPLNPSLFIDAIHQTKLLHFVRHAEGLHNVIGFDPISGMEDATLTPMGVEQCIALKDRTSLSFENVELVMVSPLRRTLQTATYSFPQLINRVPWIALDSLRELMANPCDRRKNISEQSINFPHVNFDHIIHDIDLLFDQYGKLPETGNDIVARAQEFLTILSQRPEQVVVVVTHGIFLNALFNYVLRDVIGEKSDGFYNCEMRSISISISRYETVDGL